jgi:hypothetical protein
MTKKRISCLRCPTCRTLVLKSDPEFPFCSERCRTIDLGKWASGGYVISSPIDRGDESGEADYTTGWARRVPGPGSRPAAARSGDYDQEADDGYRKRQ